MSEGGGYYRQTLSRGGAECGRGCHSIYSAQPSQRVQAHIVPEIRKGENLGTSEIVGLLWIKNSSSEIEFEIHSLHFTKVIKL